MSQYQSRETGRAINFVAAGTLLVGVAAVAALVGNAGGKSIQRQVSAKELADERLDQLNHDIANGLETVFIPGGILKGSVEVDTDSVSGSKSGGYGNPIILSVLNPKAELDSSGKFLDGGYIAVPGSDASGRPHFTAYQVELGENDGATVSIQVSDPADPVLETAAIYATNVTGSPDQIFAVDTQGNDAGLQVTSFGMK